MAAHDFENVNVGTIITVLMFTEVKLSAEN